MNFFEVIVGDGRWLYLWHGLEVTLVLTVLSLLLGTVIGLIAALMRTSNIQPLKRLKGTRFDRLHTWNPLEWLGKIYVDIIRGTPLLVQLLIMYYVVFGSYQFMPKILVAAIAFGINSGAYICEIIRGGIESIDRGQMEAARSLGMSHVQAMRYIILPQAVRNVLPDLVGNSIEIVKLTSIASVVAMPELLRNARDAQSLVYNPSPVMLAAFMYLALLWPLTRWLGQLEHRRVRR